MSADLSLDWRLHCKNQKEKLVHIFSNSNFSDLKVTVCHGEKQQVFDVHSAFLFLASEVFERQFSGNFTEREFLNAKITDIKPDIFNLLLKFAYFDYVTLENVEDACDLFRAADKYLVYSLKNVCIRYIWNNLVPDTFCPIYELAVCFGLEELFEACKEMIIKKTKEIVNNKNFLKAKPETVYAILDENNLNIKEIDLFKCVEIWLANLTKRGYKEKKVTEIGGCLIKKFHFFDMSVEEFSSGPGLSKMLPQEVEHKLLLQMICKTSDINLPDGYLLKSRQTDEKKLEVFLEPPTKKNFLIFPLSSFTHYIDEYSHSYINLTIDKKADIMSLKVTTQKSLKPGQKTYIEDITIEFGEDGSEKKSRTEFKGEVQFSSSTRVFLSNPMSLQPEKMYWMFISMKGGGVYNLYNLGDLQIVSNRVKLTTTKNTHYCPNLPVEAIYMKREKALKQLR